MLGLGFDHVEVEAQLDQRDLVMVRSMCAHRQRQPMAIHDGHDLHALPRLVGPIASPPPLAAANVASMNASRSSMSPCLRSVFARSFSTSRNTCCSHHCWKRRCTVL